MGITRDTLQREAVENILYKKRGILQWCTSLGKSKVAIDVIRELSKNKQSLKILLLVAEVAHKKNWLKEFDKWGLDIKDLDITIECYASLKNYTGVYDLVVMDEGHHAFSDIRVELLKDIKSEYIVVLSATLELHTILILNSIYGKFYINIYPLKSAIENKLLPEPSIYLIPLILNSTIKNQTIIFTKGKSALAKRVTCEYDNRWAFMNAKYPDICLTIRCSQREKYDYLTNRFEYFRRQYMLSRNEIIKNKWLQVGSERKRFLGESKTSSVAPLLDIVKNKRYVCFCASIEQSELFCSKTCIHSKKKESQDLITKFNNKEINSLYSIGMIQEGQNLEDIDLGIIVQLDGKERPFTQKMGRVMRAKEPILFIFYYKDTRDEEYLNNIIENVDREHIQTIDNINELKELICK